MNPDCAIQILGAPAVCKAAISIFQFLFYFLSQYVSLISETFIKKKFISFSINMVQNGRRNPAKEKIDRFKNEPLGTWLCYIYQMKLKSDINQYK